MWPRCDLVATDVSDRRTFDGSSGVPTSVVNTRPMSLAHRDPRCALVSLLLLALLMEGFDRCTG
jgi:hypothetical protein